MSPEIMKSIPLQNPWMQSIQWNSKTTNPAIEPILFSNILKILQKVGYCSGIEILA